MAAQDNINMHIFPRLLSYNVIGFQFNVTATIPFAAATIFMF